MKFVYDDGGREAAGFKGKTGDCVARSIAIATDLPYTIVYDRLSLGNQTQRITKNSGRRPSAGMRSAAHGIWTRRQWFKDYMQELGFTWHACMGIGTGCKVHLKDNELPKGRLVVALSRHYAAVIDGVLHDTYEDARDGTRCVYGYWQYKGVNHG